MLNGQPDSLIGDIAWIGLSDDDLTNDLQGDRGYLGRYNPVKKDLTISLKNATAHIAKENLGEILFAYGKAMHTGEDHEISINYKGSAIYLGENTASRFKLQRNMSQANISYQLFGDWLYSQIDLSYPDVKVIAVNALLRRSFDDSFEVEYAVIGLGSKAGRAWPCGIYPALISQKGITPDHNAQCGNVPANYGTTEELMDMCKNRTGQERPDNGFVLPTPRGTPTPIASQSRGFFASSGMVPTRVFPATLVFKNTAGFSHTFELSQSQNFNLTEGFLATIVPLPTSRFVASARLADTLVFNASQGARPTLSFSASKRFPKSAKFDPTPIIDITQIFGASAELNASRTFDGTEAFDKTPEHRESNSFYRTREFSTSAKLAPTVAFEASNTFDATSLFVKSSKFRNSNSMRLTSGADWSNEFGLRTSVDMGDSQNAKNTASLAKSDRTTSECLAANCVLAEDDFIKATDEPRRQMGIRTAAIIGGATGAASVLGILAACLACKKCKDRSSGGGVNLVFIPSEQ
jgi:hypothetical protein